MSAFINTIVLVPSLALPPDFCTVHLGKDWCVSEADQILFPGWGTQGHVTLPHLPSTEGASQKVDLF